MEQILLMIEEWKSKGLTTTNHAKNDSAFIKLLGVNPDRIGMRSKNKVITYYDKRRFNIELKPYEFYNSLLATAVLEFPQVIEIDINPSQNPLGVWELTVSAVNTLIYDFYYDTPTEIQQDEEILEEIFNL